MKSMQFTQWVMQFLREVKIELSKIEWPKFDDWIGSTIVSLILVLFFAIYFGAVDRIISWLAQQVFSYSV